MQKVALFIPPLYDRFIPPLGTPALTGFLKSKGVNVVQDDLNIRYYDYIRRNKLEKIFTPEYRKDKIRRKVYYYRILQYEGAPIQAEYKFENNFASSFSFTERMLSSKFLHRYIADTKENPFIGFFCKEALPKIEKENCSLIGLSITCPSQVIAGITLGSLIKKHFPEIKVVIGGQWASLFRDGLQKRNDFKKFYDYIIYFEGETPLFNLIETLKNNKPISNVPNLIYQDNGNWKPSIRNSEEDMDNLPTPDFDDLNLKKYLDYSGKKPSLTIETSRGCYWNKCIFCVDLPLPRPKYREKSPHLVIRDIKTLVKKYKVKHLAISNTTFSPSQMRQIAKMILEKRIKISWWTMARFDNGFDKDTLRLAKKAGCSTMVFGLESIKQRVLDFIDKGTKVDIIKRIIKDCHDLKLNICFQVMIGLPSETTEEALDTIFFLVRDAKVNKTDRVAFNIYYQTPKSPIFLNPKQYGIKIIYDKRLPFRFFHPFKQISGNIDKSKAQKIIKFYKRIVKLNFEDMKIAKFLPF